MFSGRPCHFSRPTSHLAAQALPPLHPLRNPELTLFRKGPPDQVRFWSPVDSTGLLVPEMAHPERRGGDGDLLFLSQSAYHLAQEGKVAENEALYTFRAQLPSNEHLRKTWVGEGDDPKRLYAAVFRREPQLPQNVQLRMAGVKCLYNEHIRKKGGGGQPRKAYQ
jgi:hypothetical protein